MTEEIKRYSGPTTTKRSYMTEFLVKCPKCKREALVSYDTNEAKLVCANCNHIERANELVRYNAVVKRGCDNCGKSIETTIPNNREKVLELTVPCPHCGIVRTYKPRNDEYILTHKNTSIGDPIFNLSLWFQCDIRGKLFWAYNRRHLMEINNYVSSKLRERQTMTYTTMVERLPTFIKEAKNRETIVKAIDKLLKK